MPACVCLRVLILLSLMFIAVISQLHISGQVIDELVEGEDAEADLIVGCFSAALKQAGEGHGRRSTGRGWQLEIGEVRVGAGALVDHPGAAPTVWIAGE